MEDTNKDIGRRIREIRESQELTQADLGKLLGVEKASVSKYEAGEAKRGLPPEFLIKIAGLGGVSLDQLITGQEKSAMAGQGYPEPADRNVEAQVNDRTEAFQAGPLKISRQEEELIYLLREIPTDMQPIALEGVRNVWVMARRKRETSQDSE